MDDDVPQPSATVDRRKVSRLQVISADGTPIVVERSGAGRPVILVAGALQGMATYRPLASALARDFSVSIYDRRGRGDSGDTAPYSVDREIDDLAAVISAAGGDAAVYGSSSGSALVLHAMERGLPIDRIVLHEPPFGSGTAAEQEAEKDEAEQFSTLLAAGRRRDVVEIFLRSAGLPDSVAASLSQDPEMQANAPTLLYDPFEVMSARSRNGRTPAQQAAALDVPGLVIAGGASPYWMLETSRRIADALPRGRLLVLDAQDHIVPTEVMAPAIAEFFSGG